MTKTQLENALRPALTAQGLERPDFSVVVPLVCGCDGVHLLVEVRAPGISQAGDPCFPGGRIEPGETPPQAAVREMEEELGIRAEPERFLGQLPTVRTILGGRTNVYVCALSPAEAEKVRLNPAEVSELLRVPMERLLRTPDAASFPFCGHNIWGMTAGAIRYLCQAWARAGL